MTLYTPQNEIYRGAMKLVYSHVSDLPARHGLVKQLCDVQIGHGTTNEPLISVLQNSDAINEGQTFPFSVPTQQTSDVRDIVSTCLPVSS
jgi:hypothetical protein